MPRTCQWAPNAPEDATTCGTLTPSYKATYAGHPDAILGKPFTLDVCDVHVPAAEAAGYTTDRHPDTVAGLDGPQPRTPRKGSRAAIENAQRLNAQTPLTPPTPDDFTGDRLIVDTELTTLATISEAMRDLADDDTRRRVATWVADRYGADA